MSDDLKPEAINLASEVIATKPGIIKSVIDVVKLGGEAAINHPKGQMLISTGTTAIAIDMGSTQYLKSVLALIGVTLGIILTSVLIVKNVLLMNDERAERKRKAQERKDTA